MSLNIGNQECTNGMSQQVYSDMLTRLEAVDAFTYIDGNGDKVNWDSVNKNLFCERLKNTSYATAKSVVEYIRANADVQVRSNITTDAAFWAWLVGLVGVLTASGGVTLSPAMATFLVTNPIPTSLVSQGNGNILNNDGVK